MLNNAEPSHHNLKEELNYQNEDNIHSETNHILKIAQEIKFIESLDDNKRTGTKEKWTEFAISKDNGQEQQFDCQKSNTYLVCQ